MIHYRFCGSVPNEKILAFYQQNRIDCFVHASEKEGLPIAVAEAESAGIPIIATSAGGTEELFDENGVLLPVDLEPTELADAIEKILTMPEKEKSALSSRSRAHWERFFDAKKNAINFSGLFQPQDNPKIQHIVLVTEGYPYTDNEKGFIESELRELVKHFTVSVIACLDQEVDERCKLTAKKNLERVLEPGMDSKIDIIPYDGRATKKDFIHHLAAYCFDKRTQFERRQIFDSKVKRLIRFWESSKYYCKACKFYQWFKDSNILNGYEANPVVIYTYWNLQPTLGICLNRNEIKGIRVFTRAHGYDFQDEQWEKSLRKPFALTVDRLVDKIVFVSKNGLEYYLRKTKSERNPEKYCYSYLGTGDSQESREIWVQELPGLPVQKENSHIIVSCASLIPLKRVDRIIDALSIIEKRRPDVEIQWLHFGDGPLRMQLEEHANRVLT